MINLDDYFYTLIKTLTEAEIALAELFTLAEAKNFLKISTNMTEDDNLLQGADTKTGLIEAARLKLQNYCNRSIIHETWTLRIDGQPSRIDLFKGYISSITSIKTYQDDGTATTESSTDTYNTITGDGGYAELKVGGSWTASDRKSGQLVVVYVAGYSEDKTSVPLDLITACKIILAEMYQNRNSGIIIPQSAKELADPYRTKVM